MSPEQTKVEAGGTQNNSSAKIEGVGLFIAVAALGMSLLSTGLWIATMVFAPQIVQSKIKAGTSKAEAVADLARKEASNAMDMVDLDRQTRKAQEAAKK